MQDQRILISRNFCMPWMPPVLEPSSVKAEKAKVSSAPAEQKWPFMLVVVSAR